MKQIDFAAIRQDFPILQREVHHESLIYFDNGATSQMPQVVLDAMLQYLTHSNANVHRGIHQLSVEATNIYESGRQEVANFIGAQDSSEIIFNSGTTAGLNFLARGFIEPLLDSGDIILTTRLEHHSNLVPWQETAQRKGAYIEFLDLTNDYLVDLEALCQRSDLERVKAIVIHQVSNVLGVEQDLAAICQFAQQQQIKVVVDGAQAIPHQAVDVAALGVDAYVFSGHKMLGPTGIGVCYIKQRWHESCQAVNFGGEMIYQVNDYDSNFKVAPWKFEAGTPPLLGVVGLLAAIRYIQAIGYEQIAQQEKELSKRLWQGLKEMDGITLYSPKPGPLVSFNIDGVHPHDASTAYDQAGIALRAGHHCAQPLMRYLGIAASLRASLMFYNTLEEVEQFLTTSKKVRDFFSYES